MSRAYVHVRGLSVSYLRGGAFLKERFQALRGVSFDIEKNECFALVGESGSGKSTAAKALLGLADIDGGKARIGDFELPGLKGRRMQEFRKEVQVVFQDPYLTLNPRLSVRTLIEEPLVIHGVPRRTRREKVAEVLEKVRLDEALLDRRPSQLSGGQRQRVCIARSLILGPSLLIADEPVSALDLSVQAQIVDLLAELRRQEELTMLFISHDMELVQFIADHVAVMYSGKIVETGPVATVFASPAHPYTRSLLEAVPSRITELGGAIRSERSSPAPAGCSFQANCPAADMKCRYETPPLIMVSPEQRAACYKVNSARHKTHP